MATHKRKRVFTMIAILLAAVLLALVIGFGLWFSAFSMGIRPQTLEQARDRMVRIEGEIAQAKATFESIRNGYTPQEDGDDVLDAVDMRLAKLKNIKK